MRQEQRNALLALLAPLEHADSVLGVAWLRLDSALNLKDTSTSIDIDSLPESVYERADRLASSILSVAELADELLEDVRRQLNG